MRTGLLSSPRAVVTTTLPWVTLALGAVYVGLDTTIYRSLLVLIAFGAAHLLAARRKISGATLLALVIGFTVFGVAEKPDGTDLWAYQAYGRMVETYRANPYVSVPDDFPDDAVMQRVLPMYRDDPSLYGPVQVAGSVVVSAATGESEIAGRLAWQLLSALAVAATTVVLWRRRVDPRAIFLFVASPLVVYQFVNQAHNDVFIGLAISGGCVLAERNKVVLAAISFAVAALIKAPAGLALVVYVVWLLARGERRAVVKAISSALACALITMAPFGVVAVMRPMFEASGELNATSLWNLIRGDVASFLWRPLRSSEEPAGRLMSAMSTLIPAIIAVAATIRNRRRPLYVSLSIALLAWFVFALRPSVWYLGWVAPLFVLWPHRHALRLTAYTTACLVVSQAWLMPVAARLDGDGRLDLIDRSAATGLGVTTSFGLWLVVASWRESAPVPGVAVTRDRKGDLGAGKSP